MKKHYLFIYILLFLNVLVIGLLIHMSFILRVDADYIVELKQENDDFTIFYLGDIQFKDTDSKEMKNEAKKIVRDGINKYQPDLIVLSGDQTWTRKSQRSFYEVCDFMESFDIPWAPVMGNHEHEGISISTKAKYYEKCKNCLFKTGININSFGDYVITITKEDKINYALIMMDTHNKKYYPTLQKEAAGEIEKDQILWYEKVIKKLKNRNNNEDVKSMLFMHIPFAEYNNAYINWRKAKYDERIGYGSHIGGTNLNQVNNGFFSLIKAQNSTKYVFCGHNHSRNFTILYEGIYLSHAVKSSAGCSYEGDMGYTIIKINDEVEIIKEIVK